MDWTAELFIILFFLVLKGFFSGSEIAMVNSDKLKLRHQAKMGNKGAGLVLKLFKKPDLILGTTLVGTNTATVIISTLGALIFIELFGSAGDLISVLVLSPILLIFGEIVPKSVFQQKADTLVSSLIYILLFFSYLFYPLIIIFSTVARFATKIVGGGETPQNMFITREEIRVLLDLSESASDPSSIDRKRIRRIIRFADTTVGEAMIPLADVVGFNEVRNMKEAIRIVITHGFNRLPVYRGNITNVKGMLMLSTWDLMDPELEKKPITDFISETLYLSPKQTIDQALPQLQAREDHMAVVDYGGTRREANIMYVQPKVGDWVVTPRIGKPVEVNARSGVEMQPHVPVGVEEQVKDMADQRVADYHDGEREYDHRHRAPQVLGAHAIS